MENSVEKEILIKNYNILTKKCYYSYKHFILPVYNIHLIFILVDPITTPAPCKVRCRDRTCISSDKVCDFFPDCAQGRHKTDMSDEVGCDQCNFEKG